MRKIIFSFLAGSLMTMSIGQIQNSMSTPLDKSIKSLFEGPDFLSPPSLMEECQISHEGTHAEGTGVLTYFIFANDFQVEANTQMSVNRITMDMFTHVSGMRFFFYEDNNGVPGAQIGDVIEIVPTEQNFLFTHETNGYNAYEVICDFPQPVVFDGDESGKKYWIGAMANEGTEGIWILWGHADQVSHDTYVKFSYNGGINWNDGGENGVPFDSAFTLEGDCIDISDYCEPYLDCTDGDLITNVSFRQIENPSDCNETGYSDYTSMTATIVAGQTYPISVTVGDGWDVESVSVWIDFDNNHVFDEDEFTYIGTGSGSVVTGEILIPEGVLVGEYRMRVRNAAVGEGSATWDMACDEEQGYGETEDYTVQVIPDPGNGCDVDYTGSNADGLGNLSTLLVANDFMIGANTTKHIDQIKLNIWGNITDGTFRFYTDENGSPSEEIASVIDLIPTSQTFLEVAYGTNIYEVTFDLPETISLTGGEEQTMFWVSLGTTMGTESVPNFWGKAVNIRNAISYVSGDGGVTWNPNSFNQDGAFYLRGECSIVGEEEGCLEAPNGQFPFNPYTPACLGIQEVVTDLGWFGEYSEVMVTAGTEYIFSTDIDTAFITIGNAEGTEVLAYGTASITWTATTTGIIRFYTHENEDCLSSQNFVIRYVECGEPVTISEPDFPCFFGDGLASNGPEDGLNVSTAINYATADDFTVEEQFNVQQIRLNILSVAEVTQTTLNIRTDNAGSPGTVLETVTMQPTESRIVGAAFGYLLHELTFDLPTPFVLAPGTYWLEPKVTNADNSDAIYWESSSTGNTGSISYQSLDNGSSWEPNQFGYQQIFFISGECEELGIGDFSDADFAYYPNPVDKILTIETKKSIENVSVYNLAGQSILSNLKMEANKINLAALPKGVYVFKVTLEGNQIETFKVIKK